ncbi:MAG: homoserine kinase [Bdellovibrionales bacterium]|nr:homoserine kinase [Bdellovibrionales bacterium]
MKSKSVTVFAPATVANVATGFDILGFAIDAIGDKITASVTNETGVTIEIAGTDAPISIDPTKNTAGAPVLKLLVAKNLKNGVHLKIQKGIPLGSGMGGSAASAVGGIVAAAKVLKVKLSQEELLQYALEGEAIASGAKHSDNVAPCLYGGLTLTKPGDQPDVIRLPFPKNIFCTVVHPAMELKTSVARQVLSREITLQQHTQQTARLAALVAGMCDSNSEWIKRGLEDVLFEPQRASLIPGFAAVKAAALKAGALGSSISGAGPSVFAFSKNKATAEKVRRAMIKAFTEAGMHSQGWVSAICKTGAVAK